MNQEEFRIKTSTSSQYPRSVFWAVEKWNGRYYTSIRSGVATLFGEGAALRQARRALKKYQKFKSYENIYPIPGIPMAEVVTSDNVYHGNAYCVKCKELRDFEGTIKTSDSGRRMAMGKCPVCGTKVNRILGKVNK